MKYFILSLLFIFSTSCANKEEEVISAKKEALHFLSSGDCSAAKKALDSISPDSDDKVYVSLYASVYQCRANYRELETVLDELGALDSQAQNLFAILASFDAGQEVTQPDDDKYLNIMKALEVIQNSSSTKGSLGRKQKFGETGGGELNYQAFFLTTILLSKYFGAYGNVDSSGSKGAGSGSSAVCLAQYNYANVNNDYLDEINTDSCTGATTSNSDVSILVSDSEYERKLCEGVVLYNNFYDLLFNLDLPQDTSDLGNIEDALDALEDIKSAGTAYLSSKGDGAAVTAYDSFLDVPSCVTTATTNTTNKNQLEAFYSVFIEGNHN